MIHLSLSDKWAVDAEVRIALRAGAEDVWQIMERFNRFVTTDPYHIKITDVQGGLLHAIPPRGTSILIGHGLGWTWFRRVGTMLYVQPGKGFAFTDRSSRGRNVGFPHLYAYSLVPQGEHACVLSLRVRGRWSARYIPRFLVKCWLAWVMYQANWLLRARFSLELKTQRTTTKQITTTLEKGTPHA